MLHFVYYTIIAILYLLVFYLMGSILGEKYHMDRIGLVVCYGFLVYFSLFQVVALPMKLYRAKLSTLSISWGIIVIALCIFSVVKSKKNLLKHNSNFTEYIKNEWLILATAIVVIGLCAINTNHISLWDAAHYIGISSSSVFSNTLEGVSVYTGAVAEPYHYYILNTDELQSAVVCQIFHLPSLVERKWSFTIAMATVFELAIYECMSSLCKEKPGLRQIGFFIANLVLMYSSIGVSDYFAYRTYEGKAIVSYMYMLAVFYFGLLLYESKTDAWLGMSLCSLSGIAFTNSALFILPAFELIILTPIGLYKLFKCEWRTVLCFICPVLISGLWLILYEVI